MALNFNLYSDSNLTQLITGNIVYTLAEDGSSGWVIRQFWLGSTLAGRKLQTEVNPGADNIEFSFADSTPASGPQVTDMGFSFDGIVWEPDGDPLDTGLVEIESGVVNAFTFYARAKVFAGATPGNYVEIQISTQSLREISA